MDKDKMAVKQICQRKPLIFSCLLMVVVISYLVFQLTGWTTVELTHAFLQLNPYKSEGNTTIATACIGTTSSCMETSTQMGQGSSTAGGLSSADPAFNLSLAVFNNTRTTGPAFNISAVVHTTVSSRFSNTSHTDPGVAVGENLANLTSCSSLTTNLTGRILVSTEPVTPQQLLTNYPYIEVGGRLKPQTCISDQKVAIIIPYRDRSYHLHVLLNHLIPFLHRQLANAVIFVVEQAEPTIFNRGSIFNIGFLESQKLGSFDCVILHDVDMIPTQDSCLYKCGDTPRHFISSINSKGLPYELYFGGVVGMKSDQYQKINGHSNLFFGWGGEDDDLFMRCQNKGYKHVRYPLAIGQYYSFKHSRDKGNEPNPDRFRLLQTTKRRQDVEGLNTVVYHLEKLEHRPLYTWILVSIDMKQIVKSAPGYMKDDMVNLLRGIN